MTLFQLKKSMQEIKKYIYIHTHLIFVHTHKHTHTNKTNQVKAHIFKECKLLFLFLKKLQGQ